MTKRKTAPKTKYALSAEGKFTITGYDLAKPFASFFPGIAGKYGIPMWVFYVNRGQCISSFGIKDKDHPILEFYPANKAWQNAHLQGFRTFLKISGKHAKESVYYEPFSGGSEEITRGMKITASGLELEETNAGTGISTTVDYFTIPNDNYAGLVRTVTVRNISGGRKKIQILDGLPQIVPFGTNNFFLKKMSRTIEAWMTVENIEKGVPFYKLAVDPADRPEVTHIDAGNFFMPFSEGRLLRAIVDPEAVFGHITDFSLPFNFLKKQIFAFPEKQASRNKIPSAICHLCAELGKGEEIVFHSIYGNMRNKEKLNGELKRLISEEYITRKKRENKELIGGLMQDIRTESASRPLDLYAGQTYLDNIMRGGYPLVLRAGSDNAVFYLYSRKHGDLERDYNRFQLQPSYYSQGNGNYRDVNQNRRCDVWFNPRVGEENIISFFNLLQADGYNPLIVKGVSFTLNDSPGLEQALKERIAPRDMEQLLGVLNKPFSPGDLILFLENEKITTGLNHDEFLGLVLSFCGCIYEAEHGEGFWSDHWTYNLDLLESYTAIFPDRIKELLFHKKVFTFFDNAETVNTRAEKYVLYNGQPRQLHSVSVDTEKKELLASRRQAPGVARAGCGTGEIYTTTLIAKLLCLAVNKLCSLDPNGCGIEMETNKPNWFDALNGLPALFGSSSCETFELKRLLRYTAKVISGSGEEKIAVAEEIAFFLRKASSLLEEWAGAAGSPERDFRFWDASASLKEEYRRLTRLGFNGREINLASGEISGFISGAVNKVDNALNKAFDNDKKVYNSYFMNTPDKYEPSGERHIKPLKFSSQPLPLFLEGEVHAMRICENSDEAKQLYSAVKKSVLYDKKLRMYKVTGPLASMPEEIGRCRAFTPGWLENESIWLHMEYKYLLEILRCGLHKEFYEEFKNLLIPYQRPERYGRNILENSSFIVSSAFPEDKLRGNGYVARLSGSTAEFIHIWTLMNVGKAPFFLNERKELNLRFEPVLASWLFKPGGRGAPDHLPVMRTDATYGFNFLGNTWVVYHNPKRKDTFGGKCVKPELIFLSDRQGKISKMAFPVIPA
ncbi:MAG: hypothetical protein WC418_07295, partial [Candidatus Omnitrophota bacterium]